MPNFSLLREEHERLAVIARRLSGMVAKNVPPPSRELYAVRMELASALIHHLKSEDWVLYPRLLASNDPRIAETARAFSDQLGGLSKAYKDYADQWGADAIRDDWTGYRRATAEMLRTLTTRMMRENAEIYPLLELRQNAAA